MTRIRELPLHEQPAARLATTGPAALSDAELLALVAGQDDLAVCAATLQAFHGWVGLLRADLSSVTASLGTPRRATHLKAALEIGRRLTLASYDDRLQIRCPTDIAQVLMVEMLALDQEELWVACLDTKNRVQKLARVYRGSVNTALVRVGEIFKEPLRINSTAIIIGHNHPSTDPTPSPEDILLTRQLVAAGKLLDCEVLDRAPCKCA
ncbi:JAB domain-containing protein [Candidatus Chloroploca asiatica]|uniref:MPN domain-containing protein n=1 Tax=Candidatus Chloroploca asiatica TaxID=1506545 RepID=A0A2H3KLP7_9CHLR|nr:JAB domain-containing protein [Candidatus Chloroploca asiatica]PDV99003.1 hypothetical protein A9Q02_14230 [Candidatus Chloroploca asiatica]